MRRLEQTEMLTRKRPIKRPKADQFLYELGLSIQTRRRNLTKGMLELVDDIDKLRGSFSHDKTVTFLQECGLSDDEISTYLAFTPKLGAHAESLVKNSAGYDAIRSLLTVNDDAVEHAMSVLQAGGRLGGRELERLREMPLAAQVSDNDDVVARRDAAIMERYQQSASLQAERFRESTQCLQRLMIEYENIRTSPDSDSVDEVDELLPGSTSQAADFDRIHKEIKTLAARLLKEFDVLFPDACVPIGDCPDFEDRLLRHVAESRYALDALTKDFVWNHASIVSTDYYYLAFDAIEFLAAGSGQSADVRRFDPRPVRKLNAVSLNTASGADLLGLDAAGFGIRASYCSNVAYISNDAVHETVGANRGRVPLGGVARR